MCVFFKDAFSLPTPGNIGSPMDYGVGTLHTALAHSYLCPCDRSCPHPAGQMCRSPDTPSWTPTPSASSLAGPVPTFHRALSRDVCWFLQFVPWLSTLLGAGM